MSAIFRNRFRFFCAFAYNRRPASHPIFWHCLLILETKLLQFDMRGAVFQDFQFREKLQFCANFLILSFLGWEVVEIFISFRKLFVFPLRFLCYRSHSAIVLYWVKPDFAHSFFEKYLFECSRKCHLSTSLKFFLRKAFDVHRKRSWTRRPLSTGIFSAIKNVTLQPRFEPITSCLAGIRTTNCATVTSLSF